MDPYGHNRVVERCGEASFIAYWMQYFNSFNEQREMYLTLTVMKMNMYYISKNMKIFFDSLQQQ